MMSAHVGEDAELYALGMLDAHAARAVDEHLVACADCRARVSEGVAVAASFAATLPQATPSSALGRRIADVAHESRVVPADRRIAGVTARSATTRFRPRPSLATIVPSALAAVLALAFAGVTVQSVALRERQSADDRALDAIVHSHFKHVSATPAAPGGPAAKILYAADGAWIYVIVESAREGTLHALDATNGIAHERDLGTLVGTDGMASLLVRPHVRVREIVIERDGTEIARATLAY